MASSAFDSRMPKAVELARAKRAPASPPSSAKASKRGAAERFPARELATSAKQNPFPEFIEPCLASLANEVPAGDRWLHEIKWDGYRLHVRIENGRVRLLTRRGLDWTHRFPPIAEAAAMLIVRTAYLDGEAVVEHRRIADFGALQQALASGAARNALLFAFDLLYLDGRDLRREPLQERKRHLRYCSRVSPMAFPCIIPSTYSPMARRCSARRARWASRASSRRDETARTLRPQRGLAEDQERAPVGVRHRWLCPAHELIPSGRLADPR